MHSRKQERKRNKEGKKERKKEKRKEKKENSGKVGLVWRNMRTNINVNVLVR
jgi:hypothetical protein